MQILYLLNHWDIQLGQWMLPNVSIKYQEFSKKALNAQNGQCFENLSSEPDFIPAFLFAALDK